MLERQLIRSALVVAAIMSGAFGAAQRGPEIALAVFPTSGPTLDARFTLPLLETRGVTHSARVGLAHAFAGAPAFSAAWLLGGAPAEGEPDRYLGAGLGLSFADAPIRSPVLSAHALVGVRIPLADRLHAFGEASVAGSSLHSGLALGVGLGYRLGGER